MGSSLVFGRGPAGGGICSLPVVLPQPAVDLVDDGNNTMQVVWQIEGDQLVLNPRGQAAQEGVDKGSIVPAAKVWKSLA